MNPLLSLRHLSRTVMANGESKAIVEDISFDFDAGQIYNVLGPSGAGKSSLLRLINRLDEPTSGEVVFKDRAQSEYTPCDLRRQIGYLFQTPHLFPSTVEDNLRFAQDDLSEQQLSDLLDQTRLGREMLTVPVDNLSVGEKQRIALARLLATDPTIALLDEPTSALDPARTLGIEELIRELSFQRGLTV
ncbi:MAG: ATP-binding cassette domain-containing protein, partial [Candidatus Zixiibacteriota bacterium]